MFLLYTQGDLFSAAQDGALEHSIELMTDKARELVLFISVVGTEVLELRSWSFANAIDFLSAASFGVTLTCVVVVVFASNESNIDATHSSLYASESLPDGRSDTAKESSDRV